MARSSKGAAAPQVKKSAGKKVSQAGKRVQVLGQRYSTKSPELKEALKVYRKAERKLIKAGVIEKRTTKPTSFVSRAIKAFTAFLQGKQKAVPVPPKAKAALRRQGVQVTKGGKALVEKGQRVVGKGKETKVIGKPGEPRVLRRINVSRSYRSIEETIHAAFESKTEKEFIATTMGGYKSYRVYDNENDLVNTLDTYRAVHEHAHVELLIMGLPSKDAKLWAIDGRKRLNENLAGQPARLSLARKKHNAAKKAAREGARRRNKG